jgi:thiamine-phosphate pyrophosphorylase
MTKPRTDLYGLYVITPDAHPDSDRLIAQVAAALRGGARLVQYRDKSGDRPRREREAREIKDLCARYGALLIINDDVALAQAVGADGVHLGQADTPIRQARERLGPGAVIGVSCHDRLDLALAAQAAGADYVAFGAVYPSPTKPHAVRTPLMLFAQARESLHIAVCAIGGLDAGNAGAVIRAGADMVAVVSGVFDRPDPEAEAERLAALF